MRIDATIDTTSLLLRLKNGERRLVYATVNAVNATAKRVQEAARQNLRDKFQLRKPDFLLRMAAVIKPFASVKRGIIFAEVSVGKKSRLLLAEFEAGGKREPFVGKRVAVPITGSAARPSKGASVPVEYQFTRLAFRPPLSAREKRVRKSIQGNTARQTRGLRSLFDTHQAGERIWKGQRRTYLIPGVGVFRRTGPGPKDTEMIYLFDSDVRIPATLQFLETAKRIADVWFKEEMERETVKAIEFARGRTA